MLLQVERMQGAYLILFRLCAHKLVYYYTYGYFLSRLLSLPFALWPVPNYNATLKLSLTTVMSVLIISQIHDIMIDTYKPKTNVLICHACTSSTVYYV